jgi:GNAT superfamily N-acetyltransferase
MNAKAPVIRACHEDDADTLSGLIRELAVYEKLEHHAKATAEDLRKHLFGPRPYAEALVAELDGAAVGFALFFHNFSTFRGQPGVYLEDLFVRPEHRGLGIGKALLSAVAKIAVDRGCGRVEWAVLDWNSPAILFYQSLGAVPMDDWSIFRVDGSAMSELAARGSRFTDPTQKIS